MTSPEPPSIIFQRCDQTARRPYSTREYIGRALWGLVSKTLFRFSLPKAYRWRAMLLRRFGAKIGAPVFIDRTVQIWHPWLLNIGDWSNLAAQVVVYNLGPIKIGSHSVISQGTWLCAGTHDYTLATLPLQRPPIEIGSGVWIAMQAFIGPGVNVGNNAVIGARSVVMKNVPPDVVAGGNPVRIIKPRPMHTSAAIDRS